MNVPSDEAEARGTPLAKAAPMSVVTDAERHFYTEVEKVRVGGTMRPNDSKSQGDHKVFTHFPKVRIVMYAR